MLKFLRQGTHVKPVKVVGPDGIIWTPEINGGMPVNIQDQTSEVIDLHLSQYIADLTLTIDPAVDDSSITGDVPGYTPVAGNIVCLKEAQAFYQAEIITVTANGGDNFTLTLDTPIDFDFTLAGGCSIRTQNMNVDGSITPQIFSVSPANLTAGTQWDIVRMIFVINSGSAMDDGKFGSLASLTKGMVVRSVNGVNKNIFNAKNNGDFAAHTYDTTYTDASLGPSGQYGFRCRRTFGGQSKNGVVIRLDADSSDTLQVLIQDDLSSLTKFHVIAQGHVVQ